MVAITGIDGLAQVTVTGAALLVNGATAFTIAGGFIRITDIISVNVVDSDSAASTIQWSADGTLGSATTITGASVSTASKACKSRCRSRVQISGASLYKHISRPSGMLYAVVSRTRIRPPNHGNCHYWQPISA